MQKDYTVFGVMADDNDERFTIYTNANNPKEAEQNAIAGTPEEIIIAGVVEGRVDAPAGGRAEEAKVTPIKGRGFNTVLARVRVSYTKVRLPFTCPNCSADLRKADALTQWDYWNMFWNGRIPRGAFDGEHGIALDQNRGAARSPSDMQDTIVAYAVHCSNCVHPLWNGLEEVQDG